MLHGTNVKKKRGTCVCATNILSSRYAICSKQGSARIEVMLTKKSYSLFGLFCCSAVTDVTVTGIKGKAVPLQARRVPGS